MKWFLDVSYLALISSYKWLIGAMVIAGVVVGALFASGVIGGGDDSGGPAPVTASIPTRVPLATPTPTPSPTSTPRPTAEATAVPNPTTAPLPAPTQPPTPAPTAVLPKEVKVPVLLEGAANVGSLEFVLSYEPTVLEVTGVEKGFMANNALLDSSIRTPGLVWTGIIDVNGISGDGSAAIITFAVVGDAGSNTALRLDSVVAYDASTLLDIITSASGGHFIVNDRSVTAPSLSFLP